ncbi:MAG: ABC transporter permease [Oscillospiraceae bacterium]|nr:ABC transporter permease [Oscillospiraceae bacterium]
MLFKQIRRNALRSRRDNTLFFGSLIAAVISFYTLLSIRSLDVMRFLETIESDAVRKLMTLIPFVYVISLFFVFFLVYFAYRYQLDGRSKEFGMYMMLGMKRSKLFSMLMGETFFNSIVSVIIGIPLALLLTELISLITARTIGLSAASHHVSFSLPAVILTAIGFAAVQLISMLFLSAKITRSEPAKLISHQKHQQQKLMSVKRGTTYLISGIFLLVFCYAFAILKMRTLDSRVFMTVVITGTAGTFLLMRGLGSLIGYIINNKRSSASGLYIFTFRQIQENITSKNCVLAVSSLLILIAVSCLTFGISTAVSYSNIYYRTVDASVLDTDTEKLDNLLDTDTKTGFISECYPVYLSNDDSVDLNDIYRCLNEFTDIDEDRYSYYKDTGYAYFISLSGFNQILKTNDKPQITLNNDQAAFYTSDIFSNDTKKYEEAFGHKPVIKAQGKSFELIDKVYNENICADRAITLIDSFIITDEQFSIMFPEAATPFCCNIRLDDDYINKNGLMPSILKLDDMLSVTGLEYETYLKGIGRNLFYSIASGYITIYIGLMFLIIANTFIGLKFLMQQRDDRHRYLTLLTLGADTGSLLKSSDKQINLFFTLILSISGVSCIFAVITMYVSFLNLPAGVSFSKILCICAAAFIFTAAAELIYLNIVKMISRRQLKTLSLSGKEA